jgi:thiamine biosynthesis lipoprotein
MMKKELLKGLALILALVSVLGSTGCSTAYNKYTDTYMDVFDTLTTFTAYAQDKESFDKASAALHSRLLELNNKFDIYNTYDDMNNLKVVNDNAGIAPVEVDSDILNLVKQGKSAYTATDGTINIAMGAVLRLWHDCRESANSGSDVQLPTAEELNAANLHTDIDNIEINEANSLIYISDSGTSLDVGSIAKGYASDEARKLLEQIGITDAILNLGGNVVALNGSIKPSWTIAIADPDNPDNYLKTIKLSNSSAISSGNYQRYFELNGRRYHHIIDPTTLEPSTANKGVTVICDNSDNSGLEGDMLSTALFILPYSDGKALADKYNATVLWVDKDDKQYTNK